MHKPSLTLHKKSTVFVLSLQNLLKMIRSGDGYFHKVSWGLDKNCGLFTNGQFLNVGPFFDSDFTIQGIVFYSKKTQSFFTP